MDSSPFYSPPPVSPEPVPPTPPRPSRIGSRVLTAMIGIPIVLLILNKGGWLFTLFCLVLALGGLRELQSAVARSDRMNGARVIGVVAYPAIFIAVWRGIPSFFSFEVMMVLLSLAVAFFGRGTRLTLPSISITLLATLYVALFALLVRLRFDHAFVLYIMLFSVWASDTAAYYGGRAFGQMKLSPLSPGKTWEGMVCGAFAAILVAMLLAQGAGFPPVSGLLMGVIIAVFAPLGDLAESFWKRELGTKDLGSILPGHGGILDRCDSILFATLGLSIYLDWAARVSAG